MTTPVKVVIVDDHPLVRNAIAELIEGIDNFSVAFCAENGRALLDFLARNELPDIILLDINMPVMGGFETMEHIAKNYSSLRVLVLSINDDEPSMIRMIKAGACGYLSKQVHEEELQQALTSVCENGIYYTPEVMKLLARSLKHNHEQAWQMNEREKQFLSLACSDLTYKEIADKMFLSPKTIDGYREDLFIRFDVKSRVGLVLYAVRNKLVDL